MFLTYHPVVSEKICMKTCKHVEFLGLRIKDVRIKMFVRCEGVLSDVRHVSRFKRKFISLGTLDRCGVHVGKVDAFWRKVELRKTPRIQHLEEGVGKLQGPIGRQQLSREEKYA